MNGTWPPVTCAVTGETTPSPLRQRGDRQKKGLQMSSNNVDNEPQSQISWLMRMFSRFHAVNETWQQTNWREKLTSKLTSNQIVQSLISHKSSGSVLQSTTQRQKNIHTRISTIHVSIHTDILTQSHSLYFKRILTSWTFHVGLFAKPM